MRRSGKGSGGGAGMNKNVSPSVKYGQPAKEKMVRGVSQIGQSMGNHITERTYKVNPIEKVRGGVIPGVGTIPLGNETNRACGPRGEGRTLYGQSGTQGQHGTPEGRPAPTGGREALKGE
jgi:hypothetical protein